MEANKAIEYAFKMWEHHEHYLREHQLNTVKTYLWLNFSMFAGGKLFNLPDSGVLRIFFAVCFVGIILGCMSLSSFFVGKSIHDPIDKFQKLYAELQSADLKEKIISSVLYDFDKVLKDKKKQSHIRGWLLRLQCFFTILSMCLLAWLCL